MGLFSRQAVVTSITAEQTVTIRFQLGAGPAGTVTDMPSMARLERRLEDAIQQARVGEFDGSELGSGEIFLYAYGPDADQLFAVMRPILVSFPIRPGQALLRYGPDHDELAREAVVEL